MLSIMPLLLEEATEETRFCSSCWNGSTMSDLNTVILMAVRCLGLDFRAKCSISSSIIDAICAGLAPIPENENVWLLISKF